MDLIAARSIFSPATGFIRRGGFDWSCNPYVGCAFGCTYCYAMFLPQNRRPKEDWGKWVEAKHNAVELAQRRAAKLAGQAVYMSSVTDPYLPAERSLFLTRGILEALVPHQPRLLVQTRGSLVVRDIDVLRHFRRVRINISIPTDSEEVWRRFEPKSPPLERRWQAAVELKSAGLSVGLCLTPLLPQADPARFAQRVAEFRPDVLVVQDFHDAGGRFGADTADDARRALSDCGWSAADYNAFLTRLRSLHLRVYEGEAGFFPP
jgi:DNA repair photolyase